jgi:histidinol-phosphatase (PHP family)
MPDRLLPHDYHLHTRFSVDSQMEMQQAIDTAVRLGLREICFTEHVDFVPADSGVGFFDPASYFAELGRCREQATGKLVIRAGIEVGEGHLYGAEARAITAAYPLDFVIGSLHWVGPEMVMEAAYFDGKTCEQAYGRYFDELLALVKLGDFDVLGHLDVPKRYDENPERFSSTHFAEPIREVLRACGERGIGIEINTGTLRKTGIEPSPSPEVLRWYRELGGEILTIGSDAHRLADMAYGFDQAQAMACEAGFTHVTTFEDRKPSFELLG